jgi:hypothetical protein
MSRNFADYVNIEVSVLGMDIESLTSPLYIGTSSK